MPKLSIWVGQYGVALHVTGAQKEIEAIQASLKQQKISLEQQQLLSDISDIEEAEDSIRPFDRSNPKHFTNSKLHRFYSSSEQQAKYAISFHTVTPLNETVYAVFKKLNMLMQIGGWTLNGNECIEQWKEKSNLIFKRQFKEEQSKETFTDQLTQAFSKFFKLFSTFSGKEISFDLDLFRNALQVLPTQDDEKTVEEAKDDGSPEAPVASQAAAPRADAAPLLAPTPSDDEETKEEKSLQLSIWLSQHGVAFYVKGSKEEIQVIKDSLEQPTTQQTTLLKIEDTIRGKSGKGEKFLTIGGESSKEEKSYDCDKLYEFYHDRAEQAELVISYRTSVPLNCISESFGKINGLMQIGDWKPCEETEYAVKWLKSPDWVTKKTTKPVVIAKVNEALSKFFELCAQCVNEIEAAKARKQLLSSLKSEDCDWHLRKDKNNKDFLVIEIPNCSDEQLACLKALVTQHGTSVVEHDDEKQHEFERLDQDAFHIYVENDTLPNTKKLRIVRPVIASYKASPDDFESLYRLNQDARVYQDPTVSEYRKNLICAGWKIHLPQLKELAPVEGLLLLFIKGLNRLSNVKYSGYNNETPLPTTQQVIIKQLPRDQAEAKQDQYNFFRVTKTNTKFGLISVQKIEQDQVPEDENVLECTRYKPTLFDVYSDAFSQNKNKQTPLHVYAAGALALGSVIGGVVVLTLTTLPLSIPVALILTGIAAGLLALDGYRNSQNGNVARLSFSPK
jgi:hypothetical protein